ncbi:MAG: cytochrome c oxidase subunit II [Rhodocyclaceae bacterium]|nr:MAG: cytochrome c oxidase subunit II [Rhodocyclaceae bacterium]
MSAVSRRQILLQLGGAIAVVGASAMLARNTAAEEAEGRVVEVDVRRFKFTPSQITVKRGEVVTLAFRSIDFVHGFNLPDMGVRADLMPGRVTKVRLQPTQAGNFAFLCDNFCGDGHETMGGNLIVEG